MTVPYTSYKTEHLKEVVSTWEQRVQQVKSQARGKKYASGPTAEENEIPQD